ncbi:MlaD family protein, partial [Aldersonia kunmingensis]|uniref:MlaD family protein n=1 Tax=Aldersonia kunmingensis TaxID=408066 RepID=UPI000A59EC45
MANLIDLRGRGPTRRQLLGLGGIAIGLVIAVAVPLVLYAQGRFDDRIAVTLTSDTVGDGLVSGADVKYRGLLVGKVDEVATTRSGGQVLTLSIESEQAKEMSGGLAASFAPSNIFGVVGVELEPQETGVTLRDGAVIPMGDTAAQVSAIGVLRDVGKVTNTLTGKQFNDLVNRFDQLAEELHPLLRSGFDLLNLAAAHQK